MAGTLLGTMDPRRSLVAGAMWLIVGLAATFSIAAAVWVGSIARANVLEQHVRRLSLETDQMSSDLGQALTARLDAIRAAGRILQANGTGRRSGLSEVMEELQSAYPQLDWIALVGCRRHHPSCKRRAVAPAATSPRAGGSRRRCAVPGSASSSRALRRRPRHRQRRHPTPPHSATWPPRCAMRPGAWSASLPPI